MYQREETEGWSKRSVRHDVDLPAVAYRCDGSRIGVSLSNISYDGCRLATEEPLLVGERITLALPSMGEMKAQIRWSSSDGSAGARFVLEEATAEERRARLPR